MSLNVGDPRATRRIDTPPDAISPVSPDRARLGKPAAILLHIQNASKPLRLDPSQEIIIGRLDPANLAYPDLDLSPYQAHEQGVSRLHAAIRCRDDMLTLVDLGSSNGTRLNGRRLVPNQPDVLHDGDEIRLGNLMMHVYMEQQH
ncbi:MAG: FHA domain-containing protein [Anaerolineae bacterium]|nr:FHA domain-containing protein [Anaerolineae bacterium]